MQDLISKNIIFQQDVYRNIIKPWSEPNQPFKDIDDNDISLGSIAIAAMERIQRDMILHINRGFNTRGDATRYGDGTFGVWYGSLDVNTSIFETAYLMIKQELAPEHEEMSIKRDRRVYKIFCDGVLVDLREKDNDFPSIISEEYTFTQSVGQRLRYMPGLIAPSARCRRTHNIQCIAANAVIFNINILNDYAEHVDLIYEFDCNKKEVFIQDKNLNPWFKISASQVTGDPRYL